jgi:hypothetical protein
MLIEMCAKSRRIYFILFYNKVLEGEWREQV